MPGNTADNVVRAALGELDVILSRLVCGPWPVNSACVIIGLAHHQNVVQSGIILENCRHAKQYLRSAVV
ncbi:hypothetical protein Mapa_015428 [Marchantia paleacea]|nr:hypothetical protein Mapa_015428 [Marchantia paleacea]